MQYSVTRKHQEVGYNFGYRHQFGQITPNYAKLHEGKDLGLRLIAQISHYLLWTYGVLQRLKIR